MKNSLLLFTFLILPLIISAQAKPNDYDAKVQSLDTTLETLYAVISGEKGEERDWQLMKFLFHPEAKLIPAGKNREGIIGARYLTVEDYIESSGKWLVENGFFEKEIHRVVNNFGNISQVFSTYESYRTEADDIPFVRGINSIQLLNDGHRWWIINIYWTGETPENPIPAAYLPQE